MSDKYQVTFRKSSLKEYPMMQKLFETERCGNRAQALLAMGEAFGRVIAPDCRDPQLLLHLAEAARKGYRFDESSVRRETTYKEENSDHRTSSQSSSKVSSSNGNDIGAMVNDMLNKI